jgi:hypothetical protein
MHICFTQHTGVLGDMGFFHDEKREKSAIAYEDIYKSSLPGAGKYVVVTHDWRFYNLLPYLSFLLF